MDELPWPAFLPTVMQMHDRTVKAPLRVAFMYVLLRICEPRAPLDPNGTATLQVAPDRVTEVKGSHGQDPAPAMRELVGTTSHAPLKADLAAVWQQPMAGLGTYARAVLTPER
jgi:hypothetical protein